MDLNKFDVFAFDLDGTIWYWDELIPGTVEVITRLKESGKRVVFLTNHTIISRKDVAKHLTKKSIPTKKESVINANYSMGRFLKEKNADFIAFGKGLMDDLKELKLKPDKEPPVDYVVVAEDWKFSQKKLNLALDAVKRGAGLIGPVKGKYWWHKGRTVPGVGGWIAAIEWCTGTKATMLGKPSKWMIDTSIKTLKLNPKKTVFIADEPDTDVEFAKRAGFKSILVRTGHGNLYNKKYPLQPDMVMRSVADILKFI